VTVVLSTGGFARSAKGHEIDPLTSVVQDRRCLHRGARPQPAAAVFIDSTGRTYTLPAHSLPSARGQGEPLSGRLNPPDGARFAGVMLGEAEDLWLLASDAGYGFTARFKELVTRAIVPARRC
jgi:topoisomerase-4 subunit A